MITKLRVRFTFPSELVTEPVIYRLGQDFNVVTNIRRADVQRDQGWVILELEGDEGNLDHGLEWVKSLGVRVDPVPGDVLE